MSFKTQFTEEAEACGETPQELVELALGGQSLEVATDPSCMKFEMLVFRTNPSTADFDFIWEHLDSCPSGLHSEEGMETRFGFAPGTFQSQGGTVTLQKMISVLRQRRLDNPSQ